jgi:ribonuclease HI
METKIKEKEKKKRKLTNRDLLKELKELLKDEERYSIR